MLISSSLAIQILGQSCEICCQSKFCIDFRSFEPSFHCILTTYQTNNDTTVLYSNVFIYQHALFHIIYSKMREIVFKVGFYPRVYIEKIKGVDFCIKNSQNTISVLDCPKIKIVNFQNMESGPFGFMLNTHEKETCSVLRL